MNSKDKTEKRRLQKLKWREGSREKVREQKRKWYQNNKEVVARYKHAHYQKNRDTIIEKTIKKLKMKKETIPGFKEKHCQDVKISNGKIRKKFLEMYGNKCVCCGETRVEFLTIEHKLGQKGMKRDKPYTAYRKATLYRQDDLYEILCMNCNHSKGRYGYCPHNKSNNTSPS